MLSKTVSSKNSEFKQRVWFIINFKKKKLFLYTIIVTLPEWTNQKVKEIPNIDSMNIKLNTEIHFKRVLLEYK